MPHGGIAAVPKSRSLRASPMAMKSSDRLPFPTGYGTTPMWSPSTSMPLSRVSDRNRRSSRSPRPCASSLEMPGRTTTNSSPPVRYTAGGSPLDPAPSVWRTGAFFNTRAKQLMTKSPAVRPRQALMDDSPFTSKQRREPAPV